IVVNENKEIDNLEIPILGTSDEGDEADEQYPLPAAMKNITAKAEELVEVKKHAATSLLEKQTSKHDIGGGGLLGEVENSNGHVANNVEHNIEGSVHKLVGEARSVTRKLDDSVHSEVVKAPSINVFESTNKVHKTMDEVHEAIDELHAGVDMLHEVADKVHQVADKVLQKTGGKPAVKAVFSLIPMALITKVVKGMFKGSLAAWKKAIKLTAKVGLLPYTITKKVLHKTSKVMGLIFDNDVPKV
ncbi:hypothetical protein ACI65C_000938, partial [Semiaphis heraclei]